MTCVQGHQPPLLLPALVHRGFICLHCFAESVTNSTAFVTLRARALTEFLLALEDDVLFRNTLMQHHRHFLVAPLCEGSCNCCTDEALLVSMVDIILNMCRLAAADDEGPLLEEFIAHISLHLSSRTIRWHRSHRFSLHAMGLLLERHSNHDNRVPQVMKIKQGFVHNIISAMQLPRQPQEAVSGSTSSFRKSTELTNDETVQEEILFVLSKLAVLEDGTEELRKFCPLLIHIAVDALSKTESDGLKTNSIALLTILAQGSIFNISLPPVMMDGSSLPREQCFTPAFIRTFAEAIKRSLMSSDIEIQVTSLQLICHVCPDGAVMTKELQTCVEEGLTDYIFELLQASGDIEPVVAVAMHALLALSTAQKEFSSRFSLGLEPVIRVLEHSLHSAFGNVLRDTLLVLTVGLFNHPGLIITATQAKRLMLHLATLLNQFCNLLKGHSISNASGYGLSPETLNATCSTLVALLSTTPSCTRQHPDFPKILLEAVTCAIMCISEDKSYSIEHGGLKSSTCLLQAAYIFYQKQALEDANAANCSLEALLELCDLHLLYVFTAHIDRVKDEDTFRTIFATLSIILQHETSASAGGLAKKLALSSWFRLTFDTMARFPSENLKQTAYFFISVMIDRLTSSGQLIRAALPYLPSDLNDLLVLFEEKGFDDLQRTESHQAIIAIFYASQLHDNRIAEDDLFIATLEHCLLANNVSSMMKIFAAPNVLKQFLVIYVSARDSLQTCGLYSMEAETVLLNILQCADNTAFISSDTPKHVLRWILQKKCLHEINSKQLFLMFRADEEKDGGQEILAELFEEDDCVTEIIVALFCERVTRGKYDDIKVIAHTLTKIVRTCPMSAYRMHKSGVLCTLQNFMLLQSCKAPSATIVSCLELLFHTLFFLNKEMGSREATSWIDIAGQLVLLLLSRSMIKSVNQTWFMPLLNLISLILHKSAELTFLTGASDAICSSEELCVVLELQITTASNMPAGRLKNIGTDEGLALGTSLQFHLLWLRCAFRQRSQQPENQSNLNSEALSNASTENLQKLPVSKVHQTTIIYKDLCRILHFGPHPIKILASSILVEIFSQLSGTSRHENYSSTSKKSIVQASTSDLKALTMIFQESLFGDNELLQANASFCLSQLLSTNCLNLQQISVVQGSPWFRMLAEDLMATLSLPHRQGSTICYGKNCYIAPLVSAILQMCPSYDWLASVFNPQAMSQVIANLQWTENITPGVVSMLTALLNANLLDSEHVQSIQVLFQGLRRSIYRLNSGLVHSGEDQAPGSDRYPSCRHILQQDSHACIMHLVLYHGQDHLTSSYTHHPCVSKHDSLGLLVKIDEFLHKATADT